jgi:hypothetical protein
METPVISKSSFIRGTKCPKALYLHFNEPEERDETSESQQHIFDIGHSVGHLAQQLFPEGIDASRGEPGNYAENIAYTQELIENGQTVIYEAAFGDGETLCYLDILVKRRGKWHAYEVKGSTSVKDYHYMDAAFQYYVIMQSGLNLANISLVHLNNKYIRRGKLDAQQLFTIVDVTDAILDLQVDIPILLKGLQDMLEEGNEPIIEVGPYCNKPYPCDFQGYCFQDIYCSKRSDHPANRDQDALDEFKDELEYPLYFMDFETIMPAIPMYDENRPYQQIPFQYSLLLQKKKNGPLQHFEFLCTPPDDPRPEFIQSLLENLGNHGTILVYNKTFENCRLNEIARDFPEYASRIEEVQDRMIDLMVPFRKKHLYMPEMNGSYSLKAVLPALIPDLSYNDLEIQEGGTASLTYESLYHDTDPESIREKRENLLEYCKLDTLSMVRLLEMM